MMTNIRRKFLFEYEDKENSYVLKVLAVLKNLN